MTKKLLAWLNGSILPLEEAKVSVLDHGFNYGDAVFEGIKILRGRVFDLDDHISRLYRSARFLKIHLLFDEKKMIENVLETVRQNELQEGYIRIVVSRGEGPLGLRNIDKLGDPNISIVCQSELIKTVEELLAAPGKIAKAVNTRRTPPQCVDPRIKACNYLNNIMADLERRAAGADFALMMDLDGYVCEGAAENVFVVKGGCLMTPFSTKCLEGLTRRSIIALASDAGLSFREADMTLYDVYHADEMFATGSLNDITWISEVDGRAIGDGKVGPVVSKLLPMIREKGFEEGKPVYE